MARQPRSEVDDKKIPAAIQMLDEGSTKKDVCAFLGIAYNTARLGTLIEEYISGVERDKEQRRLRRGKPVSQDEVVNVIEAYFSDDSISDIANRFYRSEVMIKAILEKHGALLRDNKADPLNPSFLPDNAVAESFEIGELVWSAAYSCVAEIKAKCGEDGYRIYLLDRDNHRYSNQYTYDLGSLRHLQDLGVDTKRFGSFLGREEIISMLNEAVRGANKNKVER